MNEQDVEKEIQAKELNAPRLSPELIESKIKSKTSLLSILWQIML